MTTNFTPAQTFPGNQGGPIEAAKRGVVTALRQAINGTTLSSEGNIRIDMEYPDKEETYPSIWVQFSLTKLTNAGMGHEHWTDEGMVREWMYEGRVNLTLLFLSSKERDQTSDALITIFAFSRPHSMTANQGVQVLREGAWEYSDFFTSLDENPHLSMTLNSDELRPGGQSVNVGVPWDPDTLVYEDSYSFEVMGQFETVVDDTGLYRLRRVQMEGGDQVGEMPNPYSPDGSPDDLTVDTAKRLSTPHPLVGDLPKQARSYRAGEWL